MTREKEIEQYLKRRVEGMGGLCWKFVSPGTSGVPDRIVIYNGMICFVELKTEKGSEALLQEYRKAQLTKHGMRSYVIHSKLEVDILCTELSVGMYPDDI